MHPWLSPLCHKAVHSAMIASFIFRRTGFGVDPISHHQSISRTNSFLLVVLLALLFVFNRGADLLYEFLAFSLLVGYHFFTDRRFTGAQIRAAGLMIPHLVVYLLLCTLVVWVTTEDEESVYWIIYLLPIAVAAANLSLRATLATCTLSSLLFAALIPPQLYSNPLERRDELPELMVFAVTFFLVGVLIQAFSEQHRRQLATEQQLNERLQSQKVELKASLTKLERAEETLRRRERLAALGEMAAGIAHEIRNPLGIITSSAQLLENRRGGLESKERRLFAIIQEEATRMNGLISDFLAFSRPAVPNLQITELQALLTRELEQIRPMAEQRGIHLQAKLPGQPVHAPIDLDLLQQAILNLLLNAVEASQKGDTLTVGLHCENDAAIVTFSDTGRGITPEDLTRIFNPFFTTREGGTGLGLANAHRIAESHKGELSAASAPGQGTTFTLKLPQNQEP